MKNLLLVILLLLGCDNPDNKYSIGQSVKFNETNAVVIEVPHAAVMSYKIRYVDKIGVYHCIYVTEKELQ